MVKKLDNGIEIVDLTGGEERALAGLGEPTGAPESEAGGGGVPSEGSEEKAPSRAPGAADGADLWSSLNGLGEAVAAVREEGLPVSAGAERRERVARLAGEIKTRGDSAVARSGIREAIARFRSEADSGEEQGPAEIARAAAEIGRKLADALNVAGSGVNLAEQLRDLAALAEREETNPEDLRRLAVLAEGEATRTEAVAALSREALEAIKSQIGAKIGEERDKATLAGELWRSLLSTVRDANASPESFETVQIRFPRGTFALIEMLGRAMYHATESSQYGSTEAYTLDALTDQFARHLVALKRHGLADYRVGSDGVKIGVATHGAPSEQAIKSAGASSMIVERGVNSLDDLDRVIEEFENRERGKREGEGDPEKN